MRLIHGALILALAGLPASLLAADAKKAAPSNAELDKQISALEQRVERLERREQAEITAQKKAEARKKAAEAKKDDKK